MFDHIGGVNGMMKGYKMCICWYCYWGWPKNVYDVYKKALIDLNGNSEPLKFGPSHIVWEDENFESAEWCIDNFESLRKESEFSDSDLRIVLRSLHELASIPESERDIEPDDYDGENPENFPPPHGIIMVK